MSCQQDMLPCAMHFVLVRKIRACSSKEALSKLQSEKKVGVNYVTMSKFTFREVRKGNVQSNHRQ